MWRLIFSKHEFGVKSTKTKIVGKRYEVKIALEDKVYLKMYYIHQPRSVVVDETPAKIKAQESQIARWTLSEYQQLMNFNLGTNVEP